jgi:beta-galactosidase/beta-glucuronidase
MITERIFKKVINSLLLVIIGTIFSISMSSFYSINDVSNNRVDDKNNLSDARWPRSIIRPQIDLDGEWKFRVDPENVGQKEEWFNASIPFTETILVPGAWDAQGVGKETDKITNSYIGKAWYRRIVKIPSDWSGKKVFLRMGGVHRYADIWINGEHVQRHVGYVVGFDIDLTKYISPGDDITIAIRVDNEQDWEIDALTGAFDVIDYMDINWGGIHQHVWIEARNSKWIEDVFVKPNVAESKIDLEVTLSTEKAGEQKI